MGEHRRLVPEDLILREEILRMNRTVAAQFSIGSASYGRTEPWPRPLPPPQPPYPPRPPTCCVECGRAAELFDVDAGPWCSVLCQVVRSCIHCGLPPSDAEGHWCRTDLGETWRKWSAS